jgi:hypothetical protein
MGLLSEPWDMAQEGGGRGFLGSGAWASLRDLGHPLIPYLCKEALLSHLRMVPISRENDTPQPPPAPIPSAEVAEMTKKSDFFQQCTLR